MTWEYTDIVAKLTAEDLRVAAFPVRVIGAKIASGRSFETDATGIQWMHDMDVTGKDMEAAGVLSTCRQFGVAATALKVVVDLVADEGTLSSSKCDVMTAYDQNLPRCVATLTRAATVFVHRAQEQLQRAARQAMLFQQATRADPSSAPDVIAIHVAMSKLAWSKVWDCSKQCWRRLSPGFSCWTGMFQQKCGPVSHGRVICSD